MNKKLLSALILTVLAGPTIADSDNPNRGPSGTPQSSSDAQPSSGQQGDNMQDGDKMMRGDAMQKGNAGAPSYTSLDTNNDGDISKSEYEAGRKADSGAPSYTSLDTNNDGKISQTEYDAGMKMMRHDDRSMNDAGKSSNSSVPMWARGVGPYVTDGSGMLNSNTSYLKRGMHTTAAP